MKQRNNAYLMTFLFIAALASTLLPQNYSVPSPLSPYDLAIWANRGGFIASGSAIPTEPAQIGALYVNDDDPNEPKMYRYGSAGWALVAGGGGVSTHSQLLGLDFAESGHTGFASESALNEHIATQTDPHGATMTVSQELTIGDPAATQTVSITAPSAGVARAASYTQLVSVSAAPTSALASDVITFWGDSASDTLMIHNGNSWQNLGGSYAELHAHDNSTGQSIATGTTYAKITALIGAGPYNDAAISTSTQEITINRAGTYRVALNVSFYSDTNNVIAYFAAFKGTSELDNIHFERKIGTGADVGSSAASGYVTCAAGDIITLRARHDYTASVTLTVTYANLNVERIGN